MVRIFGVATALLACSLAHASEADPWDCFGGGRYQAMSEGRVCADEPELPAGVTCELVRAKVAQHGRRAARAWAGLRGYSQNQIREAEKCLR